MAASVYLAYASRNFEHIVPLGGAWIWGGGRSSFKDQEAKNLHSLSLSMGSVSLALAVLVCMALVAYRMVFGDDHGHAASATRYCVGGKKQRHHHPFITAKQRRRDMLLQSVVVSRPPSLVNRP